MVMNMTDTFKPVVEGMEFHVIDGTGFPDAVLVSNGGKVTDGTYIDKYYYPVGHCKNCDKRHSDWCPMYHSSSDEDIVDDGLDVPIDNSEDDGFCHEFKSK